ncbi:unnamed protein product [Prorocentrum cordatum]|uniref:Uncharacterized protein n=1 Tax=Prorocentrum cordatum TaxID=2364126 RepID=A0ABN9RII8_9DINO|nr:unnamed protein product [Polarella glacialis]
MPRAMAPRRSARAARLALLALAAVALHRLAAPAFVAPPRASEAPGAAVGTAALAGAVGAALPLPARAIELTYEGFGAPELLVIALPWLIAVPGFTQWLMGARSTVSQRSLVALRRLPIAC